MKNIIERLVYTLMMITLIITILLLFVNTVIGIRLLLTYGNQYLLLGNGIALLLMLLFYSLLRILSNEYN